MSQYGMFSESGNEAVAGIVVKAVDQNNSLDEAFEWAVNELKLLSNNFSYKEANDTDVREDVYVALKNYYNKHSNENKES